MITVTENEAYVLAFSGTDGQGYASQQILHTSCAAYLADDPNLDGLALTREEFESQCAADCTGEN